MRSLLVIFIMAMGVTALNASPYVVTPRPLPCAASKCVPTPGGGGGGSLNAWPAWGIIGCAGGVVVAALVKSYTERRELTLQEAMTCGIGAFVR